jgi:hypothetical protein
MPDCRGPAPSLARLALGAGLVAALLARAPSAAAVDVQSSASVNSVKTTQDYLSDLDGDSAPDRLYASRVLRGQLRHALRVERTAKEGSLARDDARSALIELGDRLPHACMSNLSAATTVAPCADILGMLEVQEALPLLQRALATEKRKWARRHIETAIALLGGTSTLAPPAAAPASEPAAVPAAPAPAAPVAAPASAAPMAAPMPAPGAP